MIRQAAARDRAVHAGAWWIWALGLAAAASLSTNWLVLITILACATAAVAWRAPSGPAWNVFRAAVVLATAVFVLRTGLGVMFGLALPGRTLLQLPELPLPSWAGGMRIGGTLTAEQLVAAMCDGLRLATVIVCLGAANCVASPLRLLRSVPSALHEVGVALVVALGLVPALGTDIARVRRVQRLRGRRTDGPLGWVALTVPVMEGALQRSLDLAASMDTRGYGRRTDSTEAVRRTSNALVLAAFLAMLVGTFFFLGMGAPRWAPWLLLSGVAAGVTGLMLGGRTRQRTRYRPDPWRTPEWLLSVTGVGVAVAAWHTAATSLGLQLPASALTWPALPPLVLLTVLAAAGAIALTPALPQEDLP